MHRSGHERVFAGVAGGLGEHFGINAWWFRWAFIFLSVFGGVGILVYVLAWVLIPGPDEDEPIASGWVGGVDWADGGTVFGIILLGLAGVLFATQFLHVSSVLVLAAVLFIVGLLLYRGDVIVPGGSGSTPPTRTGGDNVDAEVVMESTAAAAPVDEAEGSDTDEPEAPPPPPAPPRSPKPPRERSMLGRLTIASGLIVIAVMALVDVSDLAVDIEPFHYFATIIAVLGFGLLIGAWVGRARWLIIIGILVTPMLWLSMLLPVSWDFSVGEFHHTPVSVEEVAESYEQGIGQMTIDLTELTPTELAQVGTIEASLGFGEMVVRVPDDVGVVLVADVSFGEISGPFDTVSGVGIDVTREFGTGQTVLVLDLEVGAGVIHISEPGSFVSGGTFNIEWSN